MVSADILNNGSLAGRLVVAFGVIATVLFGLDMIFFVLWRMAEEDGSAAWDLYDELRTSTVPPVDPSIYPPSETADQQTQSAPEFLNSFGGKCAIGFGVLAVLMVAAALTFFSLWRITVHQNMKHQTPTPSK